MEITLDSLTRDDKRRLLEEVMGAIAGVSIVEREISDKSSFEEVDKNYLSALSPYLAETWDNYSGYADAKNKLLTLGVELSKSLDIYLDGLSKTSDEIASVLGL